MQFFSTLLLCVVATTAYAVVEPRAHGKGKDDGIVVALFTDANSRDSRADFAVGKWDFEGCESILGSEAFLSPAFSCLARLLGDSAAGSQ